MPFKTLFNSDRVRLEATQESDTAHFARWSHDWEYGRNLDDDPFFPMNEASFKRWVGQPAEQTGDGYNFMIVTRDGDRRIGFCGLMELKWASRCAYLGIGIGEREARGQGYGYDALSLLLDFAFLELNLHRVGLNVLSYNAPAIKLYERMGFQLEGRMRERVLRQGIYSDLLNYSLLDREWIKP